MPRPSGASTGRARRELFLLLPCCIILLLSGALCSANPGFANLMPRATESLLLDVIRAGDRLIAVGERGHVLYSDDSGRVWNQAQVPSTVTLTAACFISPLRGWAAGHDGVILHTEDGGENWVLQRDGLAAQRALNELELTQARTRVMRLREQLAVASGEPVRNDIALELEDAEFDYEDQQLLLEDPVYAPPLMDINFVDEQHGLAVGAFGTLVFTEDAGRHWQTDPWRLDNAEQMHLYAIVTGANGRLMIAGEAGMVFRSDDQGRHWSRLAVPGLGTWFGALRLAELDTVLLFGLQGGIVRSADFGDSWQTLDANTEVVLAGGLAGAAGGAMVVGSVGMVLIYDPGKVVLAPHEGIASRLNLNAVVQAPDGNYVFVGQGGVQRAALEFVR